MTLTPPIYIAITIAALLLCCFCVVIAWNYRKKMRRMEHDFLQLEKKLAATHTDLRFLQQKYNDSVDFQKSLKEAKITTRLQHPRLAARHEKNKMSIPERYQYVRSLAQNGMSADLIASVLSISTREAEQLVQLSKIADDSM